MYLIIFWCAEPDIRGQIIYYSNSIASQLDGIQNCIKLFTLSILYVAMLKVFTVQSVSYR